MLKICYEFGCYLNLQKNDEIMFSVFSKIYFAGLNYYSLKETLKDFNGCIESLRELIEIVKEGGRSFMKIHNILEDIVISKVEEIFNEEEKDRALGFCTCRQCRMDVACYVLNRSEPQYVISGRGYAHLKSEYDEDSQKTTDITALVLEGIKKVSHSKRPFFPHSGEKDEYAEGRAVFSIFRLSRGGSSTGKPSNPCRI